MGWVPGPDGYPVYQEDAPAFPNPLDVLGVQTARQAIAMPPSPSEFPGIRQPTTSLAEVERDFQRLPSWAQDALETFYSPLGVVNKPFALTRQYAERAAPISAANPPLPEGAQGPTSLPSLEEMDAEFRALPEWVQEAFKLALDPTNTLMNLPMVTSAAVKGIAAAGRQLPKLAEKAGVLAERAAPAVRELAVSEVGALRITKGTSQGKEGFILKGEDTQGRRVDVFTESRAEAEAAKANIQAGRGPFAAQPVPEGVAKEPWQMTRAEYKEAAKQEWLTDYKARPPRRPVKFPETQAQLAADEAVGSHKGFVRQALDESTPVPPEVLADYPDLAVRAATPISEGVIPERPLIGEMPQLIKEQPDIYVLYDNGQPVGHIRLERMGRDKAGATLRWVDAQGQRNEIGFIGATEESIQRLSPKEYLAKMREYEARMASGIPPERPPVSDYQKAVEDARRVRKEADRKAWDAFSETLGEPRPFEQGRRPPFWETYGKPHPGAEDAYNKALAENTRRYEEAIDAASTKLEAKPPISERPPVEPPISGAVPPGEPPISSNVPPGGPPIPLGGEPPFGTTPSSPGISDDIARAEEQIQQDTPGALSRLVDRIPGAARLRGYFAPSITMRRIAPNVLKAHEAESITRTGVLAAQEPTRTLALDGIEKAFGKGASQETQIDVIVQNGHVVLTPEQKAALDALDAHNTKGLNLVRDGYGAEIGEFKPNPGALPDGPMKLTLKEIADDYGIYVPTVAAKEDVVAASVREFGKVASRSDKTRFYQTVRERMAHNPDFKPELNLQRLIEGADSFKAARASGETFRAAAGGLDRLQVMEKTHPELYQKMMGLRRKLGNIRSAKAGLDDQVAQAIDTFMASPMEAGDLAALQADMVVKPGRYVAKASPLVGQDQAAIKASIRAAKTDVAELRKSSWDTASVEPYQRVDEAGYKYFPKDEAAILKESRQTTNNRLINFLDNFKATRFGGDLSAAGAVQTQAGALSHPIRTFMTIGSGLKKGVESGDILAFFKSVPLAEAKAAAPELWARFAKSVGHVGGATPSEYAGGWLGRIPTYRKLNDANYRVVEWQGFELWKTQQKAFMDAGMPELVADVMAGDHANMVYPFFNPTRAGLSPARAKMLGSLPTSISFLVKPLEVDILATKGLLKLAARKPLDAKETLALKTMLTFAASTMTAAIGSNVISASVKGEDPWQAVLDSINPQSAKFASLVIGDARIPLAPYHRALVKAVYPGKVSGIGDYVPFAGVWNFAANRIQPAISSLVAQLRNEDFYGHPIRKGDFLEQVLRGALYQFESSIPLTLGQGVEGLRVGTPPGETALQMAGQFLGGNVMITTPTQRLTTEQKKVAPNWDKLTPNEQKMLERQNPQLRQLAAQAAADQAGRGSDYAERKLAQWQFEDTRDNALTNASNALTSKRIRGEDFIKIYNDAVGTYANQTQGLWATYPAKTSTDTNDLALSAYMSVPLNRNPITMEFDFNAYDAQKQAVLMGLAPEQRKYVEDNQNAYPDKFPVAVAPWVRKWMNDKVLLKMYWGVADKYWGRVPGLKQVSDQIDQIPNPNQRAAMRNGMPQIRQTENMINQERLRMRLRNPALDKAVLFWTSATTPALMAR